MVRQVVRLAARSEHLNMIISLCYTNFVIVAADATLLAAQAGLRGGAPVLHLAMPARAGPSAAVPLAAIRRPRI